MSTNTNYDLLFGIPDKKCANWIDAYVDARKKGDKTMLSQLLKYSGKTYINEFDLGNIIDQLTKRDAILFKRRKLLKQLSNCKLIRGLIFQGKKTILELSSQRIEFAKLSTMFPELEMRKTLESDQRIGRCHILSMSISKRLNYSNEVVTGYVTTICDKIRFTHSWIELSIDGKDYVIEPTSNIVMNKEGYYSLSKIEPISRVSKESLIQNGKALECLGLSNKEILLYWDEIVRDFEQNPQLFRR